MANAKNNSTPIGRKRKLLFSTILLLIPFIFILMLETGLRIFNYGGNLALFIEGTEKQISHYYMCNPDVGKRYFFMQNTVPGPLKDLFLKVKPENGYRIFVIGGSTTAGFPYGGNLAFSKILGFRLQDTFPEKHIEMINTAMSAINSYTLLDFIDEILQQQPDAILIYAGHNEFYGAMGIGSTESLGKSPAVIHVYLKLEKFKTFLLIRDLVGSIRKLFSKAVHGSTEIDPSHTLMARIVSEQTIPYKSELYEKAVAQFRKNLGIIFAKAKQAGVPILISELVSNLKDQEPFISVKADTFPTADKAYDIGKKLLQQGDYKDAEVALTLAKDLDALRFRAPEDFNQIIYDMAKTFNSPVVPMKSVFAAHCEHGIIGNELILEHLHPNVDGYFLMADAFYESMKKHHFISGEWNEALIKPSEYYKKGWGMSELDTASANLSIHYLKGGWPFKPKEMPNHALDDYHPSTKAESLAVRILTDNNYSVQLGHYDLGNLYAQNGEYAKAYREFKALYYTIPFELEFYEKAVENLIKMGQYEEALEVLQRGLRYGETPFLVEWTGQLLAARHDFASALPYLEKVAVEKPNDFGVLQGLLKAYNGIGNQEKAGEVKAKLDQLLVEKMGDQKIDLADREESQKLVYGVLLQKAKDFMQKKDWAKAYPLLLKCEQIHSTAFTQKWAGMLSLKFGRIEEGITFLEKASEADSKDFEIFYNLCNAYIVTKNKKARETLAYLESLRPGFKDPYNLRKRINE